MYSNKHNCYDRGHTHTSLLLNNKNTKNWLPTIWFVNANIAIPTSFCVPHNPVKLLATKITRHQILSEQSTLPFIRYYQYQHGQRACQCNIQAISPNHCCHGKAVSIVYSECVCSLCCTACDGHAPYYRPIVICSVCGHTIFFLTLSH